MPKVKKERTDWRDAALEHTHAARGLPVAPKGLGWVCLEYNHASPVAVVNYDEADAPRLPEREDSLAALGDFCSRCALPLFDARYRYDPAQDRLTRFETAPVNVYARRRAPTLGTGAVLSEEESVIGNVNTRVYHTPRCEYLPGGANHALLPSRAEAERQGFRPCPGCCAAQRER